MGLASRLRRLLGLERAEPEQVSPTERSAQPLAPRVLPSAEESTKRTPGAAPPPPRPTVRVSVHTGPKPDGARASSQYLSAEEADQLIVPDEDGHLPVRISDGFFVHIPTGKRVKPASRAVRRHGLTAFNVRGVAYHEAGHRAADTRPGKPAYLKREPDNEHDANAVAVYGVADTGRRRKIGYVNKGLARSVAKRLDSGEKISAWFMRGDPPGEDYRTASVVLADEDGLRRLLSN